MVLRYQRKIKDLILVRFAGIKGLGLMIKMLDQWENLSLYLAI
jgi:hypothetical protein